MPHTAFSESVELTVDWLIALPTSDQKTEKREELDTQNPDDEDEPPYTALPWPLSGVCAAIPFTYR